MAEYTAPPKKLDLGDGVEVKMPYALLMDLCRMLPDPATAMSLTISDPMTQDYVVRRVLTPATKVIKNEDDLISDLEVELDTDQTSALLTWVVQHILYFFAKRTVGMKAAADQFKEALPNLSMTGSPNSTSTEQ